MTAVDEQYRSEYGWSILLPEGWERLPTAGNGATLTIAPPVVFASSKDWTLALTWMVESHPTQPKILEAFLNATMLEGTAPVTEVQPVVQRIWPPIGEITEAEVVQLPDGSRALETLEEFDQGSSGEPKEGYQLILSINSGPGTPAYFQRLCFYAPGRSFLQHIDHVRRSARSFHYDRPFQLPWTEAAQSSPIE